MPHPSWPERIAEAAASKKERTKQLLAKMKERQARHERDEPTDTSHAAGSAITSRPTAKNKTDRDFGVLKESIQSDLTRFVDLFDDVFGSDEAVHTALFWPHIPPRAVLPWMLREVSRGRANLPLRTLFLNMGRPALQAVAGLEAQTEKLRERGVCRSGLDTETTPSVIEPDAHFYMFLGDTRDGDITSVPLISIVPHSVALNDGTFWRNFDEKTLKGFKRFFSTTRLNAIRRHLDVLCSIERGAAFALLLPSHFPDADRRHALRALPGAIDLAVVDMTIHALRGRDPSALIRTLMSELEGSLRQPPKHVLALTDCPLRFSFINRSLKRRRDAGTLGSRATSHRLVWATRGRGFEPAEGRSVASRPVVETIASSECVVATRLWKHSKELDENNPLTSVLNQGAAALKGMGLTASGADAILAPYTDVHDAYHRVKRERHSFDPHYNKAMVLVSEGHAGPWREAILSDLAEGLALAAPLRTDTPLMRYLKRVLSEMDPNNDVMVVLRHPEDAQQATDRLLDFLTKPGSFQSGVPELRLTTPSHYSFEIVRKRPTVVIWAASASLGARAYVGDAYCPAQFRLVVAGHDAVTLNRVLSASLLGEAYVPYSERAELLLKALPWTAKEFGGLSAALSLDTDRPRIALPFTGQGYLLLDGYGKVSAGPGSQFYVLDPVSHQLSPREARAIDVGDAVFVMPDTIREDIEAALREKDDRGRTLEQALVDHYKATVRKGVETLSKEHGSRGLSTRVHDMLFEQNPGLPSISKQAVEYWLRAAERSEVDTPHAAINPVHIEAFLRLMGAGVLARPLTDAVRIVRSDLRRDGHTNRGLFDRLLLDADSLIQDKQSPLARLQEIRRHAMESVFPVIEKHLEASQSSSERPAVFHMAAQ